MWCLLFLFGVVICASDSLWPVENRILQLKTASPRPDTPPSYMVHLYNRYRKGRMPYSSANTVRSFFPTPGKLGNDDILVFNLTGVHPTEYVERVDFHLRSKIPVKQSARLLEHKKSLMEVDILDLSRPLRPKVETLPLAKVPSGGWQTLDITDSIIACLEGEAEQHHLVGVSIRGPDEIDGSDILSQPFIVLFSEDDDHLDIEELGREANTLTRQKREILNNELPDYLSEKVDGSLVESRLKYRTLDSAVPRPEARKAGGGGGEKHRKRRRRRKDKRLPYAWGKSWWKKTELKNNPDYEGDDDEDYDDLGDENDDQIVCQKRKMVVSFAEIGWGDWVISPKTFDASYCSGICTHPPRKNVQTTNHATIQSLVQSMGLKKGVPELCCVPHTLAPLSLLYYDQNKNIILKSYPDMSVQNCSCR